MKASNLSIQERLLRTMAVYEGCGNILGIVPLKLAEYPDHDFRLDRDLRSFLRSWGKTISSDSIMVLSGDPSEAEHQGYHYYMRVFEPNGSDINGLPGGISTMCGNGVRAVAAYLKEQRPDVTEGRIMTESGLRTVDFDGDSYEVNMGELTLNVDDLGNYVNTDLVPDNNGKYFYSSLPKSVLTKISKFTSAATWSIGFNGNRIHEKTMDGEPHIIIEIPESEINNLRSLRELAVQIGPIVTKDLELFPQEINLNLVVRRNHNLDMFEILNCTHERNLGNDPRKSVTPACGTGSTVAAGIFMGSCRGVNRVIVHCWGGDLEISRKGFGNSFYMKGPVHKINCDLIYRAKTLQ